MDKIIGMGNALVDVLVRIDDDSLLEKLHLPKGSMQLIQEDTLSEIRKYTSGMKIHRSTGGSAGNTDRKSTRLNSSHPSSSRMPSSA